MASQTINGQRWVDGTSVSVYPAEARVAGSDAAPTGSAVTSSTVAAGTVTFTGLTEGRRYLAYAAGKAIGFLVQPGSVDLLRPISGIEAGVIRDDVLDAAKKSEANTFARPQVVENETAFISRQTLGTPHELTTAAGTTIFEVDEIGNVMMGPNEILNKTPGVNYIVADSYFSALTRRRTERSLLLNEVADPADLRLGRISSPYLRAALAVTVTASVPFDLIVAHAGTAFSPSNGKLKIQGMDVAYASKAVVASTPTSGVQTVSRDTPGVLNVVDATPTNPGDLLTGGTRLARCGEELIQYTNIAGNQLQGVQLYPGDARTSVSIPDGSTVSQTKLTSCVSGTSGSIGVGDGGEQNVYPVPQNGAHLAGVRPAESLGTLAWRALRNPTGAPAGTDSGEDTNVGFGGETASISAFPVEPPRLTASGGNLLLQTAAIGSIEATPRMEILHDGSIRCGPISMLGNNLIKTPNPAALFIQNTDVAKNVLRLKMVAAQSANPFDLRTSIDGSIASISPTGRLVIGSVEIGIQDGGGYLEAPEQSVSPNAPSNTAARLFARDNGSGKTQWCVRFATGAVQVLATEP